MLWKNLEIENYQGITKPSLDLHYLIQENKRLKCLGINQRASKLTRDRSNSRLKWYVIYWTLQLWFLRLLWAVQKTNYSLILNNKLITKINKYSAKAVCTYPEFTNDGPLMMQISSNKIIVNYINVIKMQLNLRSIKMQYSEFYKSYD